MCNKYCKPQKELENKIPFPNITKQQIQNLQQGMYPTKRDCPPTLLYSLKGFVLWELYHNPEYKASKEILAVEYIHIPSTSLYKFLQKPMESNMSKTSWKAFIHWFLDKYMEQA